MKWKPQFSWSEMVANNTGKTSASGFTGVVTILCGCAGFLWGSFFNHSEVLNQSVFVIGLGSALLGIRKTTKENDNNNPNISANE
jgi:hypothetical protein